MSAIVYRRSFIFKVEGKKSGLIGLVCSDCVFDVWKKFMDTFGVFKYIDYNIDSKNDSIKAFCYFNPYESILRFGCDDITISKTGLLLGCDE